MVRSKVERTRGWMGLGSCQRACQRRDDRDADEVVVSMEMPSPISKVEVRLCRERVAPPRHKPTCEDENFGLCRKRIEKTCS